MNSIGLSVSHPISKRGKETRVYVPYFIQEPELTKSSFSIELGFMTWEKMMVSILSVLLGLRWVLGSVNYWYYKKMKLGEIQQS